MFTDRGALSSLIVIQALSMAAMEMTGPFWPLHIQALLGPTGQQYLALLAMTAYAGPMLAAMAFAPVWGRLGDKLGLRAMVIRALVALGMFQVLMVFTSDPIVVVTFRCLQGGLAGFLVAAQAYSLLCCGAEKARTLAMLQSATAIGALLGPVLGGWVLDIYGFQFICAIASAICIVCAGCCLLLPDHRPQILIKKKPGSYEKTDRLWISGLLITTALLQIAKVIPQPFYSLYIAEVLGGPGWLIGISYAASAMTLAISAPLWGRLFNKRPVSQTLGAIECVVWASAITMGLAAIASNWTAFIFARLAWGVWQGALLPVMYILIAQTTEPAHHGFLFSLGNSAAKGGALLGIAVGSAALALIELSYLFWIVVVAYVVAALAIRLIRKRIRVPVTQAG